MLPNHHNKTTTTMSNDNEILSPEEFLDQLYRSRASYVEIIARLDVAISALEGKQINQKSQNKKLRASSKSLPKKAYPIERLEQIINEPYNSDWSYSDQIMWLLVNFGGMTPKDMIEKITEIIPSLSEDKQNRLQAGLGYRAKEMVIMGQLEFKTQGYFNYYWVSTPELLALKEN